MDIADNELALCQGFLIEPGVISVLGDMKGTYTGDSGGSSAANDCETAPANTTIESGYGLFSFSHDYQADGGLAATKYVVLMDGVTFDVWADSDTPIWVQSAFNLGTAASDNSFAGSVKPCFFIADGALRVSPGNFDAKDSVGGMADDFPATNNYGAPQAATADTDLTDYISAGDTVIINGQEMIALIVAATTLTVARNMTGNFTSITDNATLDTINVVPDTRWRGVIKRRNFADVTRNATFTEWYSTYSHPRPPLNYAYIEGTTFAAVDSNPDTITDSGNGFITAGFVAGMGIVVTGSSEGGNNTTHIVDTVAAGTLTLSTASALTADSAGDAWTISTNIDHDSLADHTLFPFLVNYSGLTIIIDGDQAPVLHIGYYASTTNADATWDGAVINLYTTALYDEVKQESQPNKYETDITVAAATELGVWVGVEYANAAGSANYRINKRVTGARLYYEDTTNDPGILFQLLEIDFEKGVKKAEAETFTVWKANDANVSCECPFDDGSGATHTNRTSGDAFIFTNPPKAFTYEINAQYPPDVNTHARYKTAIIANRRLYVGNVYQSGKVNGDRMISSPVNKFDILPEYGSFVIDVTKGDGDEIVKLEAYADRVLQFKKRTLYVINVAGGLGEEFLESQHRNMGVENPSQTCMTEYGVAWVNTHGVFLYDGQEISDLTREKLKMTHTTSGERSKGLNITESYIPTIGYHPDNKWLVAHSQSDVTGSFEVEAWIYDFKNGSWTYSQEFSAASDYKTNMVWTPDNNLVFAAGTNSSNTPDFLKYRDAGTATPAQAKLILRTKDFHLDAPGVKKKLKSVYVTYSANGSTEIQAHVLYQKASARATEDSQMEEADGGTDYYTEADGFKTTGNDVYTVELKPSTAVTDALSFQFQLYNEDAAALAGGNFKLYNISFVYRPLGIR